MKKKPWARLYNNTRWHRLRARQLQLYPLCWYCRQTNRLTTADTVDHVVPHRGNETLFWDPENLRSSCRQCHDSVAKEKDMHGYVRGANKDGTPVDPAHPWNQTA